MAPCDHTCIGDHRNSQLNGVIASQWILSRQYRSSSNAGWVYFDDRIVAIDQMPLEQPNKAIPLNNR